MADTDAAAPPVKTRTSVGGTTGRVVIAEGDSWFDYPFYDDVVDVLRRLGWQVHSVAHYGDKLALINLSAAQRDALSRAFDRLQAAGTRPEAVLVSAGGNDLVDGLAGLLRAAGPGVVDPVEPDALAQMVDALRIEYGKLLAFIDACARARFGAPVPVIVHGYFDPVPDGRRYPGLLHLAGPWLEPQFRARGWIAGAISTPAELERNRRALAHIMGAFRDMLRRLPATHPEVRYVSLAEALPAGTGGNAYQAWWNDELHPSADGFRVAAELIAAAVPPT